MGNTVYKLHIPDEVPTYLFLFIVLGIWYSIVTIIPVYDRWAFRKLEYDKRYPTTDGQLDTSIILIFVACINIMVRKLYR